MGREYMNTCRSLTYAVFNIPALVLNSFEQEYVMKTSKKNLIRTLAYDAARDLALLRDIFLQTPIAKSNPNSIAALFTGVECRLASINFQIIKGESS